MKFLEEIKRTLRVPLEIHWSFVILPILFIWSMGVVNGIIGCLFLIASVLFHEYAHVWMALRQDVMVPRVILLGFGAAAMLDPDNIIGRHRKELKIALAGPLASLLLATFFFIIINIFSTANSHLIFLFFINIALGLFNILPLYPMDGGRVLNAILSMHMGGVRAVKVSAMISYILGAAGVVFGLIYGYFWLAAVLGIVTVFAKAQKDQVIRGLGGI